MDKFVYTGLSARVIFGRGTASALLDEVRALGLKRPLVLTTPQQAQQGEELVSQLGANSAGIFTGATMHTPVTVTEEALAVYNGNNADGVVAIGGGSTIGLGKAIALRTDCPQIVLPTTYAGSEMTPIIGQTENGIKTTQRTLDLLPETVIYDVNYTMTLPATMSVTSGMNAIAHAVEAMYAGDVNPVLSLMAEEGMKALVEALPIISRAPDDPKARERAAYGAWLCAICLGSGGIAFHHKLCHVLGGSFDLPHAETHTIILPHAIAFNAPSIKEPLAIMKRAVGSDDVAGTLYDIAKEGGAPMSLAELGMGEEAISRAADIAMQKPYPNPRKLERDAIEATIRAAWEGARPTS